jgi:hypothetical protein
VSARTRRAVAAKLQSLQAQLAAGLPIGDTSRVGPYLEWWLDTLEAKASSGTKSVNTVDNASGLLRKWVVPALGTKRLVDLTPEDAETVLAHMVAEGKARRTVARVRSYLGQGSCCCRAPREGIAECRQAGGDARDASLNWEALAYRRSGPQPACGNRG